MGTPEETSVPSVRVKRATDDFRMSSPKTGTLQQEAVDGHPSLVRAVCVADAPRRRARATIMRYQTLSMVKCERLITNWVGAGRALPKLENTSAKTGITQMRSTAVTSTAAATMHVG